MAIPFARKLELELENQTLLVEDLVTRSEVWKSRPTRLEFSFNNLCNLKCVMCAKADGEPNWVLDRETGLRFLEDVLPFVLDWTPSANSEPLLNDVELIERLAREYGVWLHLISNGTLLTEERYERLRDRLHKLWISLDAATKETFERIRVPAKWEPVIENVRRVVPRCVEDGVEVTFNFVLMADNWREAADYVRLVAELGGRAANIQELLPNSSRYHELTWEDKVPIEDVRAVLDEAKEAARDGGVDLKIELRPPLQGRYGNAPADGRMKAPLADLRLRHGEVLARRFPGFCPMATTYLKVNPDGGVYPCCRGPEELRMGDATRQSFEEIWNGERYRAFRRRMFEGDYPEVCRTCYVLVGNPHFRPPQAASSAQPPSPLRRGS